MFLLKLIIKYFFLPLFLLLPCHKENQVDVADKIIDFSVQKIKKKVGRGECWDLASEALTYAGADWSPPFNFGSKVALKDVTRADILQFSNIHIKFKNGSMSFPKHTAIVYQVNRRQLTVLHQNFNNKRYVDTLSFSLDDIVKGEIETFRAKAAGS
jgi:hypothetical protein